MSLRAERLIEALRAEIAALGQQGGILTPAVYDTARVLLSSPPEDSRPVVEWLLGQQHEDGGWGPELRPVARHVPTLAAVLALLGASDSPESRVAVDRGLQFFRESAREWAFEGSLPDDIPVAVELILPQLLDEAAALGLELPQQPFRALRALGERRRGLIARMKPRAGTAPVHAWESWGVQPDLDVLDAAKSVGNSPAATALWLRKRLAAFPGGSEETRGAEEYLRAAAEATGTGIPGVLPTVWPIYRFEQPWALLALSTTGLLSHPALEDAVRPHLDDLRQAMRPEGLGMSDAFIFDGDITSTTIALLAGSGREVDGRTLERFQRDGLFITYAHELQPSLTTTAHGALALAVLGRDATQSVRFLLEKRGANGVWEGDKWHSSWLYATSQVMIALERAGAQEAFRSSAQSLIALQREDGGWGAGVASTSSETAYAVHALQGLRRAEGPMGEAVRGSLRNAALWMAAQAGTPPEAEMYWIGKELYGPTRVDRFFVLTARLALELEREHLAASGSHIS
ncbi:hypothetical protein JRI60_35465 [Archangium violaceum]|uniref:prenyltransferase/squalene oxidase repeat-containing protein n=1 Tax=Archangium violaceum TaxID=83451 RepID=UPI00194F3DB5|nr:prenyltransferase/squalene oxidase repeat-containing protein [Archangium violaceum]QRN94404.1 hypothetical protein JRI60_35465 [Archangium violaceum]